MNCKAILLMSSFFAIATFPTLVENQNLFPTMAGSPILLGPFRSGFCPDGLRYTDFFFTCKVNYSNPYDANVAFKIMWLIDWKPLSISTTISGLDREARIHVDQLQRHMGHELSCAVRSSYPSSPHVSGLFHSSSNHYRMEIKFVPERIELDETSRTPTEIKVVSTIPIACSDCSDRADDCFQELEMRESNLMAGCNIKLRYTDWNEATKSAVATTYIEADSHFFKNGYIQPIPFLSLGVNPIFMDYVPQPLQVGIKYGRPSVCTCIGETQCLTFDRNNAGMAKSSWRDDGYYDVYFVGMFTMVQTYAVSTNIPEFKVEIQTQTCSQVACLCGVVAREGTDVVSINTCQYQLGGNMLDVAILYPTQFSGSTIIHQAGNLYMIYFPSGRLVKVNKGSVNIINVEVQVMPDDANNVEGLCGVFSGHPDVLGYDGKGKPITYTRQPSSFIESNRILFGSSMYEQQNITYSTHINYARVCDCIQNARGWHVDCKANNGLQEYNFSSSVRPPNHQDVTQTILGRSLEHGPNHREVTQTILGRSLEHDPNHREVKQTILGRSLASGPKRALKSIYPVSQYSKDIVMTALIFGIDGYTKSYTGCSCDHDRSVHDCACCQNGGVQCGFHFRNQCVQKGHLDQCGRKQQLYGPSYEA